MGKIRISFILLILPLCDPAYLVFLYKQSLSRNSSCNRPACMSTFLQSALEELGLTFGRDLSPFTLNSMRTIVRILNEMSHIKREDADGFTVISYPKGLTLSNTLTLAENPQLSHQPVVIDSFDVTIEPFKNIPIEGYLKVISNGPMKDSRSQEFETLKPIVAESGCELPHTIDAVALVLLKYIITPSESVFSGQARNNVTGTMCIQPTNENTTLATVVREFNPEETQRKPLIISQFYLFSNTCGALIAKTLKSMNP